MDNYIEEDGREIGVVVQGAVDKEIYNRVSKSIRKHLPSAEIILSTWEGTDTTGVDYDKLVLSVDPGGLQSLYRGSNKKVINNLNRQIVSTLEGIKESSRKYIMKLRTDSILTGNSFLKYARRYLEEEKYLCFEPRNPWGNFKGQYCLCDFWFFGVRETILRLWEVPLYYRECDDGYDPMAEEYLINCANHLQKNLSEESRYISILRNNAIIIPAKKSSVLSLKYPKLNSFFVVYIKHYVLSHEDWKKINNCASLFDYFIVGLSNINGKICLVMKNMLRRSHG